MRIAVAGATGMLGHHVAREAHWAGHDVIALYRNLKLLESPKDAACEPRQADLEDGGFAAPICQGSGRVDPLRSVLSWHSKAPRPRDADGYAPDAELLRGMRGFTAEKDCLRRGRHRVAQEPQRAAKRWTSPGEAGIVRSNLNSMVLVVVLISFSHLFCP